MHCCHAPESLQGFHDDAVASYGRQQTCCFHHQLFSPQVSMNIIISVVPRGINNFPINFILKSLYHLDITFLDTILELNIPRLVLKFPYRDVAYYHVAKHTFFLVIVNFFVSLIYSLFFCYMYSFHLSLESSLIFKYFALLP